MSAEVFFLVVARVIISEQAVSYFHSGNFDFLTWGFSDVYEWTAVKPCSVLMQVQVLSMGLMALFELPFILEVLMNEAFSSFVSGVDWSWDSGGSECSAFPKH